MTLIQLGNSFFDVRKFKPNSDILLLNSLKDNQGLEEKDSDSLEKNRILLYFHISRCRSRILRAIELESD